MYTREDTCPGPDGLKKNAVKLTNYAMCHIYLMRKSCTSPNYVFPSFLLNLNYLQKCTKCAFISFIEAFTHLKSKLFLANLIFIKYI